MLKLKAIVLLMLLGAAALTAACENTVRGVGRDTEEAGEEIQDAVD